MKFKKNIILFKSKTKKISVNSKFIFRAIVRYSISLIIASIVTYLLFQIKDVNINNTVSATKDVWFKFILIFTVVLIGYITIKMNQYVFNGNIFNITMVLIAVGYAIFISIFLQDIRLESLDQISYLLMFLLPFPSFMLIWYLGIIFFERKTRPFLSKYMMWKSIGSILGQFLLWLGYWFISEHTDLIHDGNYRVDLESKATMFHIIAMIAVFIFMMVLTIVRFMKFKKKTQKNEIIKSISISVAAILIIPLTIWFTWRYIETPNYSKDYLIISLNLLVIAFAMWITSLKNTRLASSVVSNLMYAISILFIWAIKFAFEFTAVGDVTKNLKTSITLISLSIIVILIYVKNNPITIVQSLAQLTFIILVTIYILAEWIIANDPKLISDIEEFLNNMNIKINIDEMLNTVVLSGTTGMVTGAISLWYRTQTKINKNIQKNTAKGVPNGK